ncbi:glycosyltransferase family 4 protein [Lactiplantibacillus plantarum]|uniref:glycosyltransferase family 4 protein n=1 Tax=Lactiplantibacillus plantarum TaxID=1590 RepID=UPI0038522B8E|nr:glycosyltransferase family 1 protein [Lactiplantibacillus plantarum]
MINILYLHAGSEMYGADKVLLELVSGLDKSKFHPIVILPSDGLLTDELRKNHIEVYVVNYPVLRRKYFNVKGIVNFIAKYNTAVRLILRIVKERNVSLIHVNTVAVLEGIALKKRLHVPLLWHVHEIIRNPKIVVVFLNALLGIFSTKIVAVSKATAINLKKSCFISDRKVDVVYNGVDNEVFNPDVKYDYLFDELDIPRNAIRVGMIGRVNSWKGQNDFISAVEPLLESNSNLYGILVGGVFEDQEWRLNELNKRVNHMKVKKQLRIVDFRSDTPNIHNFFDVFVLPSTQPDPLPTVVLESMASCKPIVGYAHGGITEMVQDMQNGFLVQANNVNLLSVAIKKLTNNEELRNKFGEMSLIRERSRFSIESYIGNFTNIYINLVQKR